MTPFASLDAKALSNTILDWAEMDEVEISPMKLQKMVFFPHADFLAQYGLPLVKQEFEAWDYGPVIPSLYKELRLTVLKQLPRALEYLILLLAPQASRALTYQSHMPPR